MAKKSAPVVVAEELEQAEGTPPVVEVEQPPVYVTAHGGPRNQSAMPYVTEYVFDRATGGEVVDPLPGEAYGVYRWEDLAHGPVMRWQGYQVVREVVEEAEE